MPSNRRFALNIEEWPASDRAAWEAARAPGDVLDPGAPASEWSPATVRWMSNTYGHWLAWLKQSGRQSEDAKGAADVTRENVAAYVAHLRSVTASSSVADRVQKLMYVSMALAPERDWAWLRLVWRRVKAVAKPARDKRSRLVGSHQLLQLGLKLMEDGERQSPISSMDRAILYRDGLLISFLSLRPVRLHNLTTIVLGEHLTQSDGGWRLHYAAPETKGRKALPMAFPGELVPHLERYLAHHRVLLFPRNRGSRQAVTSDPANCQNLWVSIRGQAMDRTSIYRTVVARTRSAFGKAMNPHLARDAAATTLAEHDPKHVRIASAILGHVSASTTQRHYDQARSFEAARRHQENIRIHRNSRCKLSFGECDANA